MAEARLDEGRREAVLELEKERHPLDRVRSAAFALTGEAWAHLEDAGSCWRLTLRARAPLRRSLRALADACLEELGLEELRSALEERGGERDALIRGAIAPSSGLTPEQDAEIERLVAEAEAQAREKGALSDPLGIRKTWEEGGRGRR